jgi:hypothetical protein
MRPILLGIPLLAVACNQAGGQAEGESESCIRSKAWSNYEANYSLRTMSSEALGLGEKMTLKSTLYGGQEYLVQACGASSVVDLDLVFYDLTGKELARFDEGGKEPELRYTPEFGESVYVVSYLRRASADKQDVSMGIFYK